MATMITQKYETIREKRKKSQLILPPCRVCGGKATGIHYGVNTCQGCKAFFQRYQKRKEPYLCPRNGDCKIAARKRGICSACRMNKCVKLGMSKDGIRLGRYTLTERTETIKEVKNIQTSTIPTLREIDTPSSPRSSLRLQVFTEAMETMDRKQLDMMCCCRNIMACEEEIVSSVNSDNTDSMDCDNVVGSNTNRKLDIDECVEDICLNKSSCVNQLTDLYRKMVVAPELTTEQIQDMLKVKHEKYLEKKEIFGEMKALSVEEFRSIHQITGLDVDGRLELVNKLRIIENESKKQFLNFANRIPGFSSLSIEDQNSLLTASAFESELLCSFRGVDPELGMTLLKTGHILHIDELCGMFESKEKCLFNMKMCKVIQNLKLTDEELALCLAITMTFRDRRRLIQPHLVERIQLKLVSLLEKQLFLHHQKGVTKHFTKIMDMLTIFREFTEETKKSFRRLYKDEFTRQISPHVPAQCLIEY